MIKGLLEINPNDGGWCDYPATLTETSEGPAHPKPHPVTVRLAQSDRERWREMMSL